MKELFSGICRLLHPKMAFFLTSADRKGRPNVMACTWATPVSEEPPIVVVCVAKESYTASLIRQQKEFVINIPGRDLLGALRKCGRLSGRDTDKFVQAGLACGTAKRVKPPVIEGCIGYIECRVSRTVEAGECFAFFGEVVTASVEERYFRKEKWSKSVTIPFHLGGGTMVYLG